MGNQVTTFTALGQTIASVRDTLTANQIRRTHAEYILSEREFAIMSGVEYAALGKNEGERTIAKEGLLRGDDGWIASYQDIQALKPTLISLEGELARLTDLRRGMEWEVRARLVAGSAGVTDAPAGSDAEMDDLPFAEVVS